MKFDDLTPLDEKNSEYEPDEQEVFEYAEYLGFQFPNDQQYLWLAVQGLKADLPYPWQACSTPHDDIVYRNRETGQIQEEHPLDAIYREKLRCQKLKTKMLIKGESGMDLMGIKEENQSDRTKTEVVEPRIEVNSTNKKGGADLMDEIDEVVKKIMTNSERFKTQPMISNLINNPNSSSSLSSNSNSLNTGFIQSSDHLQKSSLSDNPNNHGPYNVRGVITEESEIQDNYAKEDSKKNTAENTNKKVLEEYNVVLSELYSKKLQTGLAEIRVQESAAVSQKTGKLLEKIEQDRQKEHRRRVEQELKDMQEQLKKKTRVLEETQKQRMKEERQLAQMQVEFELQKEKMLKEYRQSLKKKLTKQHALKEKELKKKYQSIKQDLKKTILK